MNQPYATPVPATTLHKSKTQWDTASANVDTQRIHKRDTVSGHFNGTGQDTLALTSVKRLPSNLMTQDIFLPPVITRGFIYGLFASDEPLQIRYVGLTTTDPVYRLKSHCSQSGRKVLGYWFDTVAARGARIGMRVLGDYPLAELTQAERRWTTFWHRYCELLNPFLPASIPNRVFKDGKRVIAKSP